MSDPEQLPVEYAIEVPPEAEAGTFADFAAIWHTPNTFVIDFVATKRAPEVISDPDTGQRRAVVPGKVVSRVRIPPEQVFEMARALTQQLTMWEGENGRKPPPG